MSGPDIVARTGDAPLLTCDALAESLASALATIPGLVDDAAWLSTDAGWPQGRDPDRPSRARPLSDDPDTVPGWRHDLGDGRDHTRAALARASVLVANAHRLAARAAGAPRPASVPVSAAAEATAALLARLARSLPEDPDARQDAHAVADHVAAARAALRKVLRDPDGTGELPPERRCQNPLGCDNERRAGTTGLGLECDACRKWRDRHGGQSRPPRRHLSAAWAKQRRVERGEDHGVCPPPWGRYVDGVGWVSHHPKAS